MILLEFCRDWILPRKLDFYLRNLLCRFKNLSRLSDYKEINLDNGDISGRHEGQTCFILGAGSSIADYDLKRLSDKMVISVSNTFVHQDYDFIKPLYHVIPSLRHGHGDFFSDLKFKEWLMFMDKKLGSAEIFMHLQDQPLLSSGGIFETRKIHWNQYEYFTGTRHPLHLNRIPFVNSVSELAITVAIIMGFKRINLLGFDHDWFNGPMVYFKNYRESHKLEINDELISFADSIYQMNRHVQIFKKYKYLNGFASKIFLVHPTKNSYVDIFPQISYEESLSINND